jgi:hypothetical protein
MAGIGLVYAGKKDRGPPGLAAGFELAWMTNQMLAE